MSSAGNPQTNVGYRFRYLDFDHQSFDGYFDANRFLLNSGSAELTAGINHSRDMGYTI
jgi:hypothetical protein